MLGSRFNGVVKNEPTVLADEHGEAAAVVSPTPVPQAPNSLAFPAAAPYPKPLLIACSPTSSTGTTSSHSCSSSPLHPLPSQDMPSVIRVAPTKYFSPSHFHHLPSPPLTYDQGKDKDALSNDFCGACGGAGEMVCCDGCDRAYHFNCCDPPLTRDAPELEEPWFCPSCFARSHRLVDRAPRIWSLLLEEANARDLSAFKLPDNIKSFFAGVRCGDQGEYADGYPPVLHTA
jgi:hypothetical protein